MLSFDTSQQRVLGLDPARHARVLGAPGSGKSTVLVEAYARVLERIDRSELDRSELDRSEGEVLAIAPNRLAAAALRTAIETRVERPLGGSPARTLASLAFSVLAAAAAVAGRPEPRLLTGTVHDEVLAAVIESRIAAAEQPGPLVPEVLRSPVLRAELREFRRVLDDFDLDPAALRSRLLEIRGRAEAEARTDLPDEDRIARWLEALDILLEADARLARDRPNELSTSALLREACLALRAGAAAPPKLLLVDDAQELGEGQLALLAACAGAGSSVWVFGDPDIATETFRGERTRALAGLAEEFARTGLHVEREEVVTLETVHRHGGELRGLIHDLTARIGSVGSGAQRAAGAAVADEGETGHPIAFAEASTPSEQIGVIAYRLRQRHLGLGSGTPLAWQRMAVICRARGEAAWIARGLAAHQVPTGVAAGGIVLREYRIVQELVRLLQHVLGIERLDAQGVLHLLSGQIGGLDPVAIRRLRGAVMLRERREAREEGRPARETDELVLDAFAHPAGEPVIDSRAGRALRRL
ncbi:MAG: AAA family ATPase, partial [Leucobacter sp.]|nr:AAA family ATPase [Leucobacter sp.]